MPKIPALPNSTPVANDDLFIFEDTSAGTTRKATIANLRSFLGIGAGWISVSDTWTYASADAPNYVVTVPTGAASLYSVGMRIRLTHSSAVKYFIIVKVTDTTLTLYGGTDYTLTNSTLSSISVALVKAPLGFPLDPLKWTVLASDSTLRVQASPTANTWYNLGTVKITVPIGSWRLMYRGHMQPAKGSSSAYDMRTSLSTSASSVSDARFTSFVEQSYASGVGGDIILPFDVEAVINPTAKTDYFSIMMTTSTGMGQIHFRSDLEPTTMRAVCAYL